MLKKLKTWVRTILKDFLGIANLESELRALNQDSKFLAVDYGAKDFTALCYLRKGAGKGNDVVDIVTFHPNIPQSVIEEEIQKMAKQHGISRENIYRDGLGHVGYVQDGRPYDPKQRRLE